MPAMPNEQINQTHQTRWLRRISTDALGGANGNTGASNIIDNLNLVEEKVGETDDGSNPQQLLPSFLVIHIVSANAQKKHRHDRNNESVHLFLYTL